MSNPCNITELRPKLQAVMDKWTQEPNPKGINQSIYIIYYDRGNGMEPRHTCFYKGEAEDYYNVWVSRGVPCHMVTYKIECV